MSRISAHYICYKEIYRLHYLKIEEGLLEAIRPLEQEGAGIEFRNGMLFLLPEKMIFDPMQIPIWQQQYQTNFLPELIHHSGITQNIKEEEKIGVWHSPVLYLTASELSTDNSRSNSYIQRL